MTPMTEEQRREHFHGFDSFDDYAISVLGPQRFLEYEIACDDAWLAYHREHPDEASAEAVSLVTTRVETRRGERLEKYGGGADT